MVASRFMRIPARASVSCVVIIAFAAATGACGSFSRSTVSLVQQSARVASPSPGLAATPLTPVGRPAIEGGIEGAFGPLDAAAIGPIRVAHVVPALAARARVLLRPWAHFEFAVGGALYLPGATSSTVIGLDDGAYGGRASGRFDLQVRAIFNPKSAVRAGCSMGLGFTSMPLVQSGVTTDTTMSSSSFWGTSSTTRETSIWARDGGFIEAQFTFAVFVAGDVHPRLGLFGGLALQNQRVVPGQDTLVRTCEASRASSCSVPRPQDENPGRELPLAQGFVSGELRFGHLSLIGSLHAALPTSPLIQQSGLFGGGIDARYTFGR